MPTVHFPALYDLVFRSAQAVFADPAVPDVGVVTEAGTPWYRYVGYRANMPQVEGAGRTQFLTLQDDNRNRWTGRGPDGAGRQGLYFSAEFLDQGTPFPELTHYQQGAQGNPVQVPYYDYQPGAEPPLDPALQVEPSTNLRSMFLFSTTAERHGLDLRLSPNGHDPNPLLSAIQERMVADPQYGAVRDQALATFDIDDLHALYTAGDQADFCRALGNAALAQPGVDHLLVTSARDGVSTNVIAQTPARGPGDPPVQLADVQPEGRATFFVDAGGNVGRGVFTVSDLLYNAAFEDPNSPPPELPDVQAVKARLLEAQQASVDALSQQLTQELENRPATPEMDGIVAALTDVQQHIDAEDYGGTVDAIATLREQVTAAANTPQVANDFRAALDLSAGVTGSLSAMADAVQAAQDRIDGQDPDPPDAIDEPDPQDVDPDLPGADVPGDL